MVTATARPTTPQTAVSKVSNSSTRAAVVDACDGELRDVLRTWPTPSPAVFSPSPTREEGAGFVLRQTQNHNADAQNSQNAAQADDVQNRRAVFA